MSVAPEHVAVMAPTGPPLELSTAAVWTPDSASVVLHPAAGTEPGRYVAPSLTPVTATSGGVSSMWTVCEALPMLPARSLQVAFRTSVPSPTDDVPVVQLSASMPEPVPSLQFHVTVTSVVFQPSLF